jgi:histone deacetylase complex subunit SAP30
MSERWAPGYSCDNTSGEELELAVLPRHTKLLVTGNNRTKSVLLGLHGVVTKAVGLDDWHWLVLLIKPLF